MIRTRSIFAVVLGILLLASGARADEPTRAQMLFDEALAAIQRNDYAFALIKLDESERLEPSVGTLVKLSECEEKLQRLVRARDHLAEAAELAEKRGDARLDAVRDRIARLDAITPKLRITKPPAGVIVLVDDVMIAADKFDSTFPVDAGSHRIAASAPQRNGWQKDIRAEFGQITVVAIPALADASVPAAPTSAPPLDRAAPTEPGAPRKPNAARTVGWVLAGAGVVGLGVGATFGVIALTDKNSAHCDANNVCDPGSTAGMKTAATISDVGWIAGGALLASGVTVILLSRSGDRAQQASSIRVVPAVATNGGQVMLGGAW